MRVEAIYVYPVKAAKAVRVQEARLAATGLEHDRTFMIVDSKGEFLTQREHPNMAAIAAVIEGDTLVLTGIDRRPVAVPLRASGPAVRATVWDDAVDAIDCGPLVAGMLTNHIGTAARLVRFADGATRQVDRRYADEGDHVSFADAFPVLVTTTASVDAVGAESGTPSDALRFRPNIVVSGERPFEEDEWSKITVGECEIDLVKPCSRCVVLDVDPARGVKAPGVLAALARVRPATNNKVYLGMNGIPRSLGVVRAGDIVRVSS